MSIEERKKEERKRKSVLMPGPIKTLKCTFLLFSDLLSSLFVE